MKLHYPKVLRLTETLFLLYFVLLVGKWLHLDLGVNVAVVFLGLFFLALLLSILELIKNWQFVKRYLKEEVFKKSIQFAKINEENQVRARNSLPSFLKGGYVDKGLPIIIYPATIFSFFIYSLKNSLVIHFLFVSTCIFLLIFDIFFFKSVSNLFLYLVSIFCILSYRLSKFKKEIFIFGSILFLALCPFFISAKKLNKAEKSARWAYVFLVIGTYEFVRRKLKELKSL